MSFFIEKISYALGENEINVNKWCAANGRDFNRLIEKTGFEKVYATNKSDIDFFTDFLLDNLEFEKDDALVLVNQSSKTNIPGLIPRILNQFNENSNVFTLEMSEGCSGFAKALLIADSFFKNQICSRLHIVCAEKYSVFFERSNLSLGPIFSDAISLTTLRKGKNLQIIGFSNRNYYGQHRAIIIDKDILHMNGPDVLSWIRTDVVQDIKELLKNHNIANDEIVGWHFHQASKIVVETLGECLNISGEKLFTSEFYGNSVSSSLPLYFEANNYEKISYPGLHLISGFGVGLNVLNLLVRVDL